MVTLIEEFARSYGYTPPTKGKVVLNTYNKEAVEKAIKTSRKPINKKEAKLIHALLKGRRKDND